MERQGSGRLERESHIKETDEIVLKRREKQIEYGKNTLDYETYCRMIPKEERKDTMPRTPAKHRKYSRREWDGVIKNWKQMIHALVARYNDNGNDDMDQEEEEGTSVSNWGEEVDVQDISRTGGDRQGMEEDFGSFYRWVPVPCIWEELSIGGPGAWKLHLESDYKPLLLQPGATGPGGTLGFTHYHMVTIKSVKEELHPMTTPQNYFRAKISVEAEVSNECTNLKEDIASDIYLINGKGGKGVIRVEIIVRIYRQEKTHQVSYFASKEKAVAVAKHRVKELL